MNSSEVKLPFSVNNAINVLLIATVIYFLAALFESFQMGILGNPKAKLLYFSIFLLQLSFVGLILFQIREGKGWARMLYLIFASIFIFMNGLMAINSISLIYLEGAVMMNKHGLTIIVQTSQVILHTTAFYFLKRDESKLYFKKSE